MGLLGVMGSSVGCSATGERLVSAARDGDLQEAKALLEYNPHLARYSTFGVRNSPLHYSAAHGHHEIVKLLLDSGVDINLRNNRGQTALMLACQLGHWEIVQTLVIFGANIHEADNLNGGTALHFAAINGHCRCIRLLLADYVPSVPNIVNIISKRGGQYESIMGFDKEALLHTINKAADGGITAIHMAALNGHVESTLLLLDLGASVYSVTIDDGSIIDLIGAGSTPLHYAACGGNEQCCQLLIARGARLTAKNANGWTPSMVARSWHRNWLDGILSKRQAGLPRFFSSPYLSLPLMSIVKIARECGWRNSASKPACLDTCVVCLERTCSVAAEGCRHKFCTLCALYLCSTNIISSVAPSPPGSIACPLCRKGIVSFVKLRGTLPLKELSRTSLSLSVRPTNSRAVSNLILCKLDLDCIVSPLASRSFSSLSCRKFPVLKCQSSLCKEIPQVNSSLIPCRTICQRAGNGSTRCSKATMRMLTKREDHGSH